jgi:hypothetical protein
MLMPASSGFNPVPFVQEKSNGDTNYTNMHEFPAFRMKPGWCRAKLAKERQKAGSWDLAAGEPAFDVPSCRMTVCVHANAIIKMDLSARRRQHIERSHNNPLIPPASVFSVTLWQKKFVKIRVIRV